MKIEMHQGLPCRTNPIALKEFEIRITIMAKDKKKSIQRPKALPPKGFRDYFGGEVDERNLMLAKIS